MDQCEFRCDTCGSPHVSIPDNLRPESEVCCGRCNSFVATWSDYRQAIALVISYSGGITADPIPISQSLH